MAWPQCSRWPHRGQAQARPFTYDCDTNEGSYSQLSQAQDGPAYQVRGTITPLQVRHHEQYAPSAHVRLESAAGDEAIAIQLFSPRRDENFELAVTTGVGAADEVPRTSLGNARLNQRIPFDLSVSSAGEAIVRIGVEQRRFRVALGAGAKVALTCSTGEFEFSDVELSD